MTPQLQQAIKLLQLSHLDLETYVSEELERNPLLERDERDQNGPAIASPGDDAVPDRDSSPMDGPETDLLLSGATAESAAEVLDTDYDNLYDGDSGADIAAHDNVAPGMQSSDWGAAGTGGGSFDGGEYNLEDHATAELSLRDHLLAQLHLSVADPRQRLIGAQLIDAADDAGYMREPLNLIAARVGCAMEEATAVLEIVQGFEPTGVMARDLAECLALQLQERNRLDPMMRILLENLAMLARHDHDGLMKLCGADAEDIAGMIAEIRALNPKPGLAFGGGPAQPVVPDVFVRRAQDGSWMVELNSATLPKVLVNTAYCTRVVRQQIKPADRVFISEQLSNANWLVKSLEQRARTILKVSAELVRQQEGFLTHGVGNLKPLNLRTIADAIEIHESTVSRVTANKYIATPRGIYEMKYFFTAAISATLGGDAHSAESVRHKIKALIDAEPRHKVLSDDKIVDILLKDGVDIARRTVAKYREAMRIPSSVERRRAKRLTA